MCLSTTGSCKRNKNTLLSCWSTATNVWPFLLWIKTESWAGASSNPGQKLKKRISKTHYLSISQSDCISTDKSIVFFTRDSSFILLPPSPPPPKIINPYSFPHSTYVHLSACDFWQTDRKWLNLAKAIYSELHNIPSISTPPPCSHCHHLIYMKIDKMPSGRLSSLLSFLTLLGGGNTCPRHGMTMEKPKFPFAHGLQFAAIQITPCVCWLEPGLAKINFLKQLVVGHVFSSDLLHILYQQYTNQSGFESQKVVSGLIDTNL